MLTAAKLLLSNVGMWALSLFVGFFVPFLTATTSLLYIGHFVEAGRLQIVGTIADHYNGWIEQHAALRGMAYVLPDRKWNEIADNAAKKNGLARCLGRALIWVESKNGKAMKSTAGAVGYTQLMPYTARAVCGLSEDERNHPEKNIECGFRHLKDLIDVYGLKKGLQAYNAGPDNIGKTIENREYPGKIEAAMKECERWN